MRPEAERLSSGDSPGHARQGGHNLEEIREQLLMTTAEMAAIAGVSEEEVAEMERGQRPVPPGLIAELMEELNAKCA
ncbi:MAG: helix-turn-helix domain-containing protein [Candidatus Limnocylindrales bacterium]